MHVSVSLTRRGVFLFAYVFLSVFSFVRLSLSACPPVCVLFCPFWTLGVRLGSLRCGTEWDALMACGHCFPCLALLQGFVGQVLIFAETGAADATAPYSPATGPNLPLA